MIEIRNIKDRPVELYSPKNELIGTIDNVLSFDDVRLQIKEKELSGYYVIFKGEKIGINKNGRVDGIWPIGFFDHHELIMEQLIRDW